MSSVGLIDSQLLIDGVPRTILCASLFPFRIPREQWRERLVVVKELGYHCVDVYIPWNFHESAPSVWDFSGRRDIEHFLELATEVGLYVLARPGPYICSEWDGGGLPAWLSLDPELRLRQFEPRFLEAVERWFDKILPLLARQEISAGGSVILVQLENELDFFDCDDPSGYVGWLRDSALRHKITVPLIACAGQGDIRRASGDVPGVVPAVNLYPSDESDDVESLVRYYESYLRHQGFPLLVTETNRRHRTLKRLVGGGVRLLGPYLQASGWNFDFGTAVNNWGDLLGFMTHDYDFGGAIAPDGSARDDAEEGRRLARLINALGPRLAAGKPARHIQGIEAEAPVCTTSLQLDGGGQLLSLTNLGEEVATVTIRSGDLAVQHELEAGSCDLLLRDLPLADGGMAGTLRLSTAELLSLSLSDEQSALEVHARAEATLLFEFDACDLVGVTGDASCVVADGEHGTMASITGTTGTVSLSNGTKTFEITIVGAQAAAPHPEPETRLSSLDVAPPSADRALPWRLVATALEHPASLESLGHYSGSARYQSRADLSGVVGFVLRAPSDILEFRVDGEAADWQAIPGTDTWIALPGEKAGTVPLDVRVQVWGHSNFDDPRLPSLRLGSLRGIGGLLAVTTRTPLADGWTVQPSDRDPFIGATPPPRAGWGGWMTGTVPQSISYERVLQIADGERSAALRVQGGLAAHEVKVDGVLLGRITPLNPVLSLGLVRDGQVLSVTTTRSWGEGTGEAELLLGDEVGPWDVLVTGRDELLAAASAADYGASSSFPVHLSAGESRWVRIALPAADQPGRDAVIRVEGEHLMLTFATAGAVLGRLWTQPPAGAQLKGGRGDVMLVPGPWRDEDPIVHVLVEATASEGGTLMGITVGGSMDKAIND